MKARVRATGEIIEVIPYSGFDDYDYYDPETKLPWFISELSFDVTDSDPDYWTRLEHQAAIAAMGGMCGNTKYNDYAFVDMAKLAIKAAHALVEKMKEADR